MSSSVRSVVGKMYGFKLQDYSLRAALFQIPDFVDTTGEELVDVTLSARIRFGEIGLEGTNFSLVLLGTWSTQQAAARPRERAGRLGLRGRAGRRGDLQSGGRELAES